MAAASSIGQTLNMILLGKTGHGKSALGNTILQEKRFPVSASFTSTTIKSTKEFSSKSGRQLCVVDTTSMIDRNDNSFVEMKKAFDSCPEGFHACLIVLKYGTKFTDEEKEALTLMEKMFGEKLMDHAVVVFTHGDFFYCDMEENGTPEETFKSYILEQECYFFKNMLQSCGNRLVLVNNRNKDKAQESAKVIAEVDKVMKANGDRPFTPHVQIVDKSCFPGRSVAVTRNWKVTTMTDLKEGQEVLAYRDGCFVWSPIFMIAHSSADEEHIFLCIATNSRSLVVSPGHHVFVSNNGKLLTKAAKKIIQGDKLIVYNELTRVYEQEEVRHISEKEDQGLFAPITLEGNMVVGGVLASCYVDLVPPRLSHTLLWPLRTLYRVSPSALQSVNKMGEDGIPHWARWVIDNIM